MKIKIHYTVRQTWNNGAATLHIALLFLLSSSYNLLAQSFEQLESTALHGQRYHSNSSSWADVDGDGDEDLFITNGERNEPNEFYLNEGKGEFRQVEGILTQKDVPSFSSAWADYDRDGDLDLYVTNCDYTSRGGFHNFLFRNDGGGSFTKASLGAITSDAYPSYACSWVDYDNDGWLDLFVVNAYDAPNNLYRNLGDGSFEKITTGPMVEGREHTISCSWVDYDNDGDQDLYVINADWGARNFFYENDGSGNFRKVENALTEERFEACRSASWGDFNNDGWLDVLIVNREDQERLFLSQGNRKFKKVEEPAIVFNPNFSGNGSQWGDFDNDGDLDLILIHHFETPREFHVNNGDGTFSLLTNEWTESVDGFAWSLNAIDFDKDGRLDIFQPNRYKTGGGVMHNYLFRNVSDDCREALQVSLRGTESNLEGYGAQLRLYGKNMAGDPVMQMREMSCLSSGGYTTQSGLRLHFGLGDWTVDSLVVNWPSGMQHTYQELPWYNRHLVLVEDGSWEKEDDLGLLEIIAENNPECPGNIHLLRGQDFQKPLEWFRIDQPGQRLATGETLSIPLEMGRIGYTAVDGCGQSDTLWVDFGQHLESQLFPNPTSDYSNLVLAATPQQEFAQVNVYDPSGRLMDQWRVSLETGFTIHQLDLRHYASGTYLIQISSQCWHSLEKVVVMRP